MGTKLDRYEIDAELGRGAMGVVYRARDPKLDRIVAIKTVSIRGLDPSAEQEYRKRFAVEARAAGRLSHPGIVTIFDIREEEAEPYLVMEYVDGQSLQQLVNRENHVLPLSTTLRLIQEIAEALHYAHSQGVVHRDIKPANILVSADGHPKIADFGIAKLNQSDLTLPGEVLGSPAFMAPEQLNDATVDARSDLFSLGVVLYYVLTGHRPFQGNSTTTVCFKLVNHQPIPVSAFEAKFPPELDVIVSRAMAKDPEQRYQSGMAMASDLQALRDNCGLTGDSGMGTPSPARYKTRTAEQSPQKRKLKLPSPLLPAGVLAVLLVGLIFWNAHKAWQSRHPMSAIAMNARTETEKLSSSDWGPAIARTPTAEASSTGGNKQQVTRSVSSEGPRSSTHQTKHDFTEPKTPKPVRNDAMLRIEIRHPFSDALASLWVDNRLVYTQSLHADRKKRALLFRIATERRTESVHVASGKHEVRVRIQSAGDSYDRSSVIADAVFAETNELRIVCDKKRGLQLSLQKGYPQ